MKDIKTIVKALLRLPRICIFMILFPPVMIILGLYNALMQDLTKKA